MRRAARVDATQAEVIDALRAEGAMVWIIGLPVDLCMGVAGVTTLIEVKRMKGKRAPKPAKYTALQAEFMRTWKGGPVATLTDAEGARRLVATIRGQAETQKRMEAT